jgi:predicted amidohydrolase YtcJ
MSNYLLTNANVYTVNPRQPRAEAIAIANDRIVAVGRAADLDGIQLPDLQRVDMRGAFVTPGLIDAHLHLQYTGFAMRSVDLDLVPSLDEALARVRARAAQTPKGDWIEGWGWLQSIWTPSDLPTRQQLDAATPDHPVALRAKSGHALWANSLALRLAGVDRNTPDPSGGQIVRDASGDPTGVFLETAENLIHAVIPKATAEQQEQAVIDAMRAMNKAGLTSAHCMDGDGGINSFKTYQRVLASGQASLRVVKMLPVQALDEIVDAGLRSGFGGPWLRIGNVKIFTDGALGPKTAWMAAPYQGEAHNHGLPIYDPELLVEFTRKAHRAGLAVVVHAIGDRANHEMLNAIEISRKAQPVGGLRDRIEHAQVLLPGDIARFAGLDVIASMQPIHATSDMHMVDANWGTDRATRAYAWRTLWDSGARLAFGSDAPVERFDPLAGIYAAVTRRRADGTHAPDGWHTQECVTIDEALYGYTLGAAYAGYSETELGSIEPGKLADLTVLARDLTAIPASEILNTQVERVMVGGEWKQ